MAKTTKKKPKPPRKPKPQPAMSADPTDMDAATLKRRKSEAARLLGLLGGAKGGKARAENLSEEELSAIGRAGAEARWGKAS